jgi:hypothetical protein
VSIYVSQVHNLKKLPFWGYLGFGFCRNPRFFFFREKTPDLGADPDEFGLRGQ